jgi:AraC-like DNA-binding protein
MNYCENIPSPPLRSFIKCYWLIEDDSPLSTVQRIVPDGRSELILNIGCPFQGHANGQWVSQPESFYIGQISTPFLIRPNGPLRTIGVRFHPHGARRILRYPAHEFIDSVIPLSDISPYLNHQLGILRDLSSTDECFHALDRMFEPLAQRLHENARIAFAVEQFERSCGLLSVTATANQLGLSPRQFQRSFLAEVGISPKFFCRIQRFQAVWQVLEHAQSDWVDIAIRSGYYDQAHLIRDFRQFAGKAPTALMAEELDLTRRFSVSGKMSHFSNTKSASPR